MNPGPRPTVADVLGRAVSLLAAGVLPAGRHEFTWPDATTRPVPGLYFAVCETPGARAVRRFVLVGR